MKKKSIYLSNAKLRAEFDSMKSVGMSEAKEIKENEIVLSCEYKKMLLFEAKNSFSDKNI